MIMNARWITTSAPASTSCTAARSSTSAWRYSVFRRPSAAGSNGRRAIARIAPTSRLRSNAGSSERPMSPVGPVIATVSFWDGVATARVYVHAVTDRKRSVHVARLARKHDPRGFPLADHAWLDGLHRAGARALDQLLC